MSEIKYLDINGLQTFKEEEDALLQGKQETLVSGTNIKTINGESVLGSGNLDISGGLEIIEANATTSTGDTLSQSDADKLRQGKAILKIGKYYFYLSSYSLSQYRLLNITPPTYDSTLNYTITSGSQRYVLLNADNTITKITERSLATYMIKDFEARISNNSSRPIDIHYMTAEWVPDYKHITVDAGAYRSFYAKELWFANTGIVITPSSTNAQQIGPQQYALQDGYAAFTITDAETSEGSDAPISGGTQLYSHDVTISGVIASEPVSLRIVAITNVPSLDASQDWSLSILTNTIRFYNMSDNYSEDCVTFGFTAPATINQSTKNGQSATITFDEAPTITDTVTIL